MIGSFMTFAIGYVSSLAFKENTTITPNLHINCIRRQLTQVPEIADGTCFKEFDSFEKKSYLPASTTL